MTCTLLVLLLTLTGCAVSGEQAASGPEWGIVDSSCSPDRMNEQLSHGITVVVLQAAWDRYFPSPDHVNEAYADELGATVGRCMRAGLRVVLDSGAQYPPRWVEALPNALLRDQRGRSPRSRTVNSVFSDAVVRAQSTYLHRLSEDAAEWEVSAIRIGTSSAGEIGYPGPDEGGAAEVDSWWAFDGSAQSGADIAPGQVPSPMPGWVPGQSSWGGRPVMVDDARSWLNWYEQALVRALVTQAETVRGAGFQGELHVPSPGRGVLPDERDSATARLLGGPQALDDDLHRGLDYTSQFTALAASVPGPLVIDLTSVDDSSAIAAREATPRQDICLPNDAGDSVDPDTPVAEWSNLRFARAQVARAALPVIGENPGPPSPSTGGAEAGDSLLQQIRHGVRYARDCQLAALLVAFERDLYVPRSGVSLADYEEAQSQG